MSKFLILITLLILTAVVVQVANATSPIITVSDTQVIPNQQIQISLYDHDAGTYELLWVPTVGSTAPIPISPTLQVGDSGTVPDIPFTIPDSLGSYRVETSQGGITVAQSVTIQVVSPNLVHLPLLLRAHSTAYTCPTASVNTYDAGLVFQYDNDNPVRPAYNHADKNIALRGYTPNSDADLQRELVDYGAGDPIQPPQLATLFTPYRVPDLEGFYQIYGWLWAPSPDPGSRGDPTTTPPVTALGLATTPGEILTVPTSDYDLGSGYKAIVLFADQDTLALHYTRDDTAATGYTVHLDGICTDPNLLALYNALDATDGPRYTYTPPESRPYSYELPILRADQTLGTAGSSELVVAIVDTGTFQDPRSCNEWWQTRPGYAGTCPPAR